MLDNFREWLSDNLRYILLGLAILIVLVLLFFGIKALTSVFSKDDEPKKITPSTTQEHVKEKGLEASNEEKDTIDFLIEDEYEAIDGYDKAISKIMRMDLGDAAKKGVIADLEEIRRDEFEHVEKLKRMKEALKKKEETNPINEPSLGQSVE